MATRICYFDCFGGASGDMIAAALLDAMEAKERRNAAKELRAAIPAKLHVRVNAAQDQAIAGTCVHVEDGEKGARRMNPDDLIRAVGRCKVSARVKKAASAIVTALAEAEAKVHGLPLSDVHFHELGAVDTLFDAVAAPFLLERLDVEAAFASAVPLGTGVAEMAHGTYPLPAPATLLLLRGVPVKLIDAEVETITPTGAAILTTICEEFGALREMTIERVGIGIGSVRWERANVLRVWVGHAVGGRSVGDTLADAAARRGWMHGENILVECNIDDMNPQDLSGIQDKLIAAGALDAWTEPIQMKKGRAAIKVSALCMEESAAGVVAEILARTSSGGVRYARVGKLMLQRTIVTVETSLGEIRMKVFGDASGVVRAVPEFDDVEKAARKAGIPVSQAREIIIAETTKRGGGLN
jgi:hypothetical protein